MIVKKIQNNALKIITSVLLGGAILYWMYRDFDFHNLKNIIVGEMNWTWMILSLPFGVLAQVLRGLRWRQTLEPMGERTRRAIRVNSIFLSYGLSLIIPRSGEFARCAVLTRKDGASFVKALGTVVTERAIDTVLLMIIAAGTIVSQIGVFNTFCVTTGTNFGSFFQRFTQTGYIVSGICLLAIICLAVILLRHLAFYQKVRVTLNALWQGVTSLKDVKNKWLFWTFTVGIWISYFIHYFLTFFCFTATAHLGLACVLVTFVVGSIAVIVPTPNGAGPWHFAVEKMLILYGVAATDALSFVFIVHATQTLLIALLGIYSWIALSLLPNKSYSEAIPDTQ